MKLNIIALSGAAAIAFAAPALIPVGAGADAAAQRGRMPMRAAMTYVAKAGSSDLYEIESSRIAMRRARRPEVRRMAEQLIADHSRTTQMVAAAAREDGLSPTPPRLEPKQRTMIRQLERSGPTGFDRMYLSQQIPAHQEALMLHRDYARRGDGAALRRTAAGAVPIVQGHLGHARQLQRGR